MRRAKIVCTIGPASRDDAMIRALIGAGMNVARLNFSHGTHEQHAEVIERVRRISDEMNVAVALLQDLQGPKIRVQRFADGKVTLSPGQKFTLVVDDVLGDDKRVSTTYTELPRDVQIGQEILLDDGLMRLRVERIGPDWVETVVEVGGVLKDKKGMNLPDTAVSLPSLSVKDRDDLAFGIEQGVDFVALSFVRSPLDVHQLRCYMPQDGSAPHIISKIEKPQAVRNLHDIVAASDGIMVARGDLGVEMPAEQVPLIQKQAIRMANAMGRISITATQMLETMTTNPRPTRAEASDVANAIFDGTDAVMLSGETASGDYPLEAVQMMARIVEQAERSPFINDSASVRSEETLRSFQFAIARAATVAAQELNVGAIVCFTVSGGTPRVIKSQRPRQDVVAFTPDAATYRRMALYRGITPLRSEVVYETDTLVSIVEEQLIARGISKPGDQLIIVMGVPVGTGVPTNTIKFHAIPYRR
jgi:pyruvate kinase